MLITANFTQLMHDAPNAAGIYAERAKTAIDSVFGEGFASKNPALVATFIEAAMLDFSTTTRAKVFESAMQELAGAVLLLAQAIAEK